MRTMLGLLLVVAVPAFADEPTVTDVLATPSATGWRFEVTVLHDDADWEHYADAWEVLAPDGARLGIRQLLHPHVDEQPFTRSLSGVEVPGGLTEVRVRARDSVHGWGPPVTVELPD